MSHNKFQKIKQFRHLRKTINDMVTKYHILSSFPMLTFVGTVKLHGTNAGIQFRKTKMYYQSRRRLITPDNDNMGFATSMEEKRSRGVLNAISAQIQTAWEGFVHDARLNESPSLMDHNVTVFGEWAGEGIQDSMAVCQIPKSYFIFAIEVGDYEIPRDYMMDVCMEQERIYNIHHFPSWSVVIDFSDENQVESAFDQLIQLSDDVAKQCPVASYFDIEGPGEGIVWQTFIDTKPYRFKLVNTDVSSKGKKKKTPNKLSPEDSLKIEEFINQYLDERRMEQGIEYLQECGYDVNSARSIGPFIGFVCKDVSEEEADTIEASDLNKKALGKAMQDKARNWFMTNYL